MGKEIRLINIDKSVVFARELGFDARMIRVHAFDACEISVLCSARSSVWGAPPAVRSVPPDVEDPSSKAWASGAPRRGHPAAQSVRPGLHARSTRVAPSRDRAPHVSLSLSASLAAIGGATGVSAHSDRPAGVTGRWSLVPVQRRTVGAVRHRGEIVSRTARHLPGTRYCSPATRRRGAGEPFWR